MNAGDTSSAFEHAMAKHDPMAGFEFEMETRVPRAAKLREEEAKRRREEAAAHKAEEDTTSRQLQREEQGGGQRGGEGSSSEEAVVAPEPAPQTDEVDDGEHTESSAPAEETTVSESEKVVEPRKVPQRPQEAQEGVQASVRAPEAHTVVQEPQEGVEQAQRANQAQSPHRTRAEAVPLKGGAEAFDKSMKFDHGSKGVQLARFPEGIIQVLQARLAELTGGLEPPHNGPLVVGFLLAQLGLDSSDYDENTRLVARLFAQAESPRLDAIEEAVSSLGSLLGRLGADQRSHTKAVRTLSESVEGLELAQSYLLSDRLEQSGRGDATGGGADLANPQASATLENMRRTARQRAAQRTVAEGRPIR